MRKSWFLVVGGLTALLLVMPRIGLTQPSSAEFNKLLQEIEALKAGQKAISNDLQEIKKILSSRLIARPFVTSTSPSMSRMPSQRVTRRPRLHSSNSPTTSDPSVPDTSVRRCQSLRKNTLRQACCNMCPRISRWRVSTSWPQGLRAFWCAHEQGKGGEMHNRLFANQQLQPEALGSHAQALGLDGSAFRPVSTAGNTPRKSMPVSSRVSRPAADGHPGVFPGVYPGRWCGGQSDKIPLRALPFETFKAQIDQLLDAQKWGSMPASRRPARHLLLNFHPRTPAYRVVFGTWRWIRSWPLAAGRSIRRLWSGSI